jgi:hypothetical protein
VIIIHRCDCGHKQADHVMAGCQNGTTSGLCPCNRKPEQITVFPSELVLSIDERGNIVEDVREPGSIWGGRSVLCGCSQCRNLYERTVS